MEPNHIHDNGLLEQYLLGLTSREESMAVEEYLARNPEARRELDHLRSQLGLYLEDVGVNESVDKKARLPREEVLREQVDILLARNRHLSTFRTGLVALCLLLFATSFFFYRQSRNNHSAHIAEKARHVQDDHLHAQEIEHLTAEVVHWDSLHTVVATSDHGNLQLHYLLADSMVLLDLSHLQGPAAGYAYHVHRQTEQGEQKLWVVDAGKVNALYPLDSPDADLRIIYGPSVVLPSAPEPKLDLVAELSLADFRSQR